MILLKWNKYSKHHILKLSALISMKRISDPLNEIRKALQVAIVKLENVLMNANPFREKSGISEAQWMVFETQMNFDFVKG